MLISRYKEVPLAKMLPKKKSTNPMLFLVESYIFLILVGTILLRCPFSLKAPIRWIDAFFTATSATCVTGLSVVDIGSVFSNTGLWIIAALIQIGGLGIMTFSTAILLLSGMRPGFNQQAMLKSNFTQEERIDPVKILLAVIPFTIILEGIGALVLFTQFDKFPLNDRILYSVFHSISAFCNAGFSPFHDSLMSYQFNPVVCFSICALVLAGGFGFLSLAEARIFFNFKTHTIRRISLHTKIAFFFTIIIIAVASIAILAIEWNGAFADESIPQKILSSCFMVISARTAGFNNINLLTLQETSLLLIIVTMFIGANPGSCGGGIKTTTAAVIALLGFNRLLGREKTQVLGRTIPEETVDKAVRIFIIYTIMIVIGTFLLLITEYAGVSYEMGSPHFLKVFFEVVSALTTCGLSLGLTPDLTFFGRIVICIIMFIGRMGALFLISAVAKKVEGGVWYAEEDIMVG